MLMGGCVEEDVFILKGNLGNVILHETYEWGFDYSPVTFKLFYETNNERRLICEILGLYVPYTDPKPNEYYMYFRDGVPNGYNPIFVNPNEFSLSEYEDIKNTLKINIAVIDKAAKTRKKSIWPISEKRQLKIGSIRYIDLESLKHTYIGTNHIISLVVAATGAVGLETENNGMHHWSSIGFVINDGKLIVIDPDKDGSAYWDHKTIRDIETFISGFTGENKKTLFDDFFVKIADDHDEFWKASTIWVNRRDAGR